MHEKYSFRISTSSFNLNCDVAIFIYSENDTHGNDEKIKEKNPSSCRESHIYLQVA